MKTTPIPKTLLKKFRLQEFSPKTSFYREICNLKLNSLEAFNDKIIQKVQKTKERVIVTFDAHPIKVWSKNYANACWGASSCGTFFGYKLFASILHGKDTIIQHLLAPANYNELDFAFWQVKQVLQKIGKINVLLVDRGYFSFEFFAFLMQKGIGFVTIAKNNTSAIKPYLRTIAQCQFHDMDENTCYHESLIWFEELKKYLRVIFVRKFVNGEIREYEIITNLSEKYSSVQVINLYSKRQGREDVFDRLKNELGLHKPCKITDFDGVKAFVALVITSYNVYTFFSHSLADRYVTVQVMYRNFLFENIDLVTNASNEEPPEQFFSEAERYKLDNQTSLFHS